MNNLSYFSGKKILVTGGAGAFGKKFLSFISSSAPAQVVVFSRDEMKHAALKRDPQLKFPWLKFRLGDVCRLYDLQDAAQGVDIIIHAAAMKHLPECEDNPLVSSRVNILARLSPFAAKNG